MRWAWCVAALLACGCATTSATRPWLAEDQLPDLSPYGSAKAVILRHRDFTHVDDDLDGTRHGVHRVIHLLRPGAEDLADVRIEYRAKDETVRFIQARMRQAGGPWETLPVTSILGDEPGEEKGSGVKVFRFPNARPGATLEYAYELLRADTYFWADSQETVGEYPVHQYEMELSVPRFMHVETKEYNSTAPIQVRKEDKVWRFSCTIWNIPARERLAFAPHWSFREPRWEWRGTAYHFKTSTRQLWPDWGRRLYGFDLVGEPGKLLAGWEPPSPPTSCGADVRCLTDALWTRIDALLPRRPGGSLLSPDKLVDAARAGEGSPSERAVALREALRRAGVASWLAFLTLPGTRQFDPAFPSTFALNALLVTIPLPGGGWLVVDPACVGCAPGQVGAGMIGATAVEVSGTSDEPAFRLFRVEGPAGERRRQRRRHAFQVSEVGRVVDEVTAHWKYNPELAHDVRTQWRSPEENTRAFLENGTLVADAQEVSGVRCERYDCTATMRAEYERLAVVSGGELVVPLTVLGGNPARDLPGAPTGEAMHFTGDGVWNEVVEVHVPPGYRLAQRGFEERSHTAHQDTRLVVEPISDGARVEFEMDLRVAIVPADQVAEEVRAARLALEAAHRVLVFERTTGGTAR